MHINTQLYSGSECCEANCEKEKIGGLCRPKNKSCSCRIKQKYQAMNEKKIGGVHRWGRHSGVEQLLVSIDFGWKEGIHPAIRPPLVGEGTNINTSPSSS